MRDYQRKRYSTNPAFKLQHKSVMKSRVRVQYSTNPSYRQQLKTRIQEQYSTDPAFRQRQRAYLHRRYHHDAQFRKQHMQRCRIYQQARRTNPAVRIRHKLQCALGIKRRYLSTVSRTAEPIQRLVNSALDTAIATFRERVRLGPTLVCTVCHRTQFPNQVRRCIRGKYTKNLRLAAACLTGQYIHVCDSLCPLPCTVPRERLCEWICYTCDSHLGRGNMPPHAVANNMALAPVPLQLARCNILERHLLAKVLPFAKIVSLPKGRQRAVHGAVICVPSEVETVVNALPRPSADAQLIQMKLKRKIKYKGHQHFYKVDMQNVLEGLRTLKATHPEYRDVTIDESATFDNVLDDEPGDDAPTEDVGVWWKI